MVFPVVSTLKAGKRAVSRAYKRTKQAAKRGLPCCRAPATVEISSKAAQQTSKQLVVWVDCSSAPRPPRPAPILRLCGAPAQLLLEGPPPARYLTWPAGRHTFVAHCSCSISKMLHLAEVTGLRSRHRTPLPTALTACVLPAGLGSPVAPPTQTLALPLVLPKALFQGPWASKYLHALVPRQRTWYIQAPKASPVPVRVPDYTSDDEQQEDLGSLTLADYLLPHLATLGILTLQASMLLGLSYLV